MNNDLEIIFKTFPKEQNVLNVYALGDIHVGSQEYNEKLTLKKIDIIKNDPYGVVCLCGDLGDYGLKNSKTNVYKATMSPKEQKNYIFELFEPIKNKIAAAVPGNHEDRITKEAGLCPMYDLCVLWDIPEVYRENAAITKYSFGSLRGGRQQSTFVGLTTHGASRAIHKKDIACFEGVDFAISGHTHTPEYSPHGRIRVDRTGKVKTAKHIPYKEIVVDAGLSPGGYGLKKEFEIAPPQELQYLELKALRDSDPNRTLHRIMNYHTIAIE